MTARSRWLERCRRRLCGVELILVAVAVGGLLWALQAEQAALPVARRWAEARIAAGQAPPAARAKLEAAFRAAYSWRQADGALSAYPVGRDSYYFMRLARNIAQSGTPCPASPPGGACRDTLANAPAGRPMIDPTSPQPWAIALVYKALQAMNPSVSILEAGRLQNRLMLILCALLTYVVVRELAPYAPRTSAVTAAVLLVLTPVVMERTFGVDDDVWVLALTLLIVVACGRLLAAAAAGSWRPLAAVVVGAAGALQAATWGGWRFAFVMVVCAGAVALAEALRRGGGRRRRTAAVAGGLALAGLVFAGVATALIPNFFAAGGTAGGAVSASAPPPDVFASVAELALPTLGKGAARLGWPMILAAGIGLLVLLRRLWPWGAEGFPATALLVLAWGAGALVLAPRAERFLLLLAPPLAMLAGVAVGGLAALFRRTPLGWAVAPLAGLVLMGTAGAQAVALVRNNRPQLDSAWVQVLTKLRRTTPSNAVLVGWWDVGHWATFWAHRAVAVDGASLNNPRVNAVGRLLGADADHPLGALLRRAACGTTTACHRPVYLLTSSTLLRQQGWMISAFWRPARALWVDQLIAGKRPTGVPAALLAQARAVHTAMARALFAAPQARIWSTAWAPCRVEADGTYTCPLHVTSANGWLIERFVVPRGRVAQARLVARPIKGGAAVILVPSLLRLATAHRLLDVRGDAPPNNPGVLLDTVKRRAFLGSDALLRSLVARLVLLDGRYDRNRFELVAAGRTPLGGTVRAWRVR